MHTNNLCYPQFLWITLWLSILKAGGRTVHLFLSLWDSYGILQIILYYSYSYTKPAYEFFLKKIIHQKWCVRFNLCKILEKEWVV